MDAPAQLLRTIRKDGFSGRNDGAGNLRAGSRITISMAIKAPMWNSTSLPEPIRDRSGPGLENSSAHPDHMQILLVRSGDIAYFVQCHACTSFGAYY